MPIMLLLDGADFNKHEDNREHKPRYTLSSTPMLLYSNGHNDGH